jgi:hypothetical protein
LQWQQCRTCEQSFTGDMQLGLAEAHWEMVQGLPAEDWERHDAMNGLALALQQCSHDYEAALPLLEECLAVARRVVGDEHPDTLAAISNLANLHREMGHLEQALTLGSETLAVKRRTLGSEHPKTLVSSLPCILQRATPSWPCRCSRRWSTRAGGRWGISTRTR